MDKTALLSFDIENGQRVIDALEAAGIAPDVAMWAVLPEYEDWRLVIASKYLNPMSPYGGYSDVNAAVRKADIPWSSKPTILIRGINEPFIHNLQQAFTRASNTYGMRLGGQKFGDQYIDDAFVYRIR